MCPRKPKNRNLQQLGTRFAKPANPGRPKRGPAVVLPHCICLLRAELRVRVDLRRRRWFRVTSPRESGAFRARTKMRLHPERERPPCYAFAYRRQGGRHVVHPKRILRSKLHLTDAGRRRRASRGVPCRGHCHRFDGSETQSPGLKESTEVIRRRRICDDGADADGAEGDVLHIHCMAGRLRLPACELADGSRVQDAIDAAEAGAGDAATAVALNLARVVSDGEQIVVPSIEADAADGFGRAGRRCCGRCAARSKRRRRIGYRRKVNINVADAPAPDTLPG